MSRDNPRVLITGVNGLLGQNLAAALAGEYTVTGADLGESALGSGKLFSYRQSDLTDGGETDALIGDLSPDIIINTAALMAFANPPTSDLNLPPAVCAGPTEG